MRRETLRRTGIRSSLTRQTGSAAEIFTGAAVDCKLAIGGLMGFKFSEHGLGGMGYRDSPAVQGKAF